jgi:thiamine-phosphate pyrophosphorylase
LTGRRSLPRLCAITDSALAGGMPLDAVAVELARGGATWIQLRGKDLAPGRFLVETKAAIASLRDKPSTLILVNDRVDVALVAEADGAHVGQDDLPPKAARGVLGPAALIGFSTHSLDQGVAAAELPVDYIAIGPVFGTRTKPEAGPVVGLETVRRLARAIRLPVIGIGGIGPDNARQVLDAGAAGVAVIAALYAPGREIAQNAEGLLRALVAS